MNLQGPPLSLFFDYLLILFLDGPEAGQTIPHFHLHLLPRKNGQFKQNDDVYEMLENRAKVSMDPVRPDRSMQEMFQEAQDLARFIAQRGES